MARKRNRQKKQSQKQDRKALWTVAVLMGMMFLLILVVRGCQ